MVVCFPNEKEEIIRVQAMYDFEGKNNDELTFKKGDTIVLTQAPSLKIHKDCQNQIDLPEKIYENDPTDWWEGYIGSKIGWFPCNYVEVLTEKIDDGVIYSNLEKALPITQNILKFHKEILRNLTTFETDHVSAIHETLRTYVRPLHRAGIMNLDEYNVVLSNLEHIAIFHTKLLTHLTNQISKPVSEQRIGHLYLMIYPKLSALLSTYCQNHPAAMALVVTESKKHAIQCFLTGKENLPSTSDLNVKWQKFCSSLSQPFRHIERYTNFFKELDRLLPENHMDRGDIIRARELMSQLTIYLQELRKSKELEIEILNSTIEGWEGEPILTLGPIFNITRAIIISRSAENKAQKSEKDFEFDNYQTAQNSERYFILFSQTLLLLSPNSRLNGFIYQGKLPLVNLSIMPSDMPESFVVHNSLIDPITAQCETQASRDAFISAFKNHNSHTSAGTPLNSMLMPNPKYAQNNCEEPSAKMGYVNVVSTPLKSNLPSEIQNASNGTSNNNNGHINTELHLNTLTNNEQSYRIHSNAPPPVHIRRRKDHPHMTANARDLYESAVSLLTTASTNLDQSHNSYPDTKINQSFQLQSPNESVYENAFTSHPLNNGNDNITNNNDTPDCNNDSNIAFIPEIETINGKDTYSVIDSLNESELKAVFPPSSKFQLTPLPCLRPILQKSLIETAKNAEKGAGYDDVCLQLVEKLCSSDQQESIISQLEELYEKGVHNTYSNVTRNKSHGSTTYIDQKLNNVNKRLDKLETSISQIKTAVGLKVKTVKNS